MTVVHFQTDFDRPTPVQTVPVKITTGLADGPVPIVDGLNRGDRIIGRFELSPGLVALKVAAGGAPIRVTVRIGADAATAAFARQHTPDSAPSPYATRLIVVRSQGQTRGAVMLGRRPSDFTFQSTAVVSFDLAAEDVTDDGLLIVELAEGVPGSYAACGLRLDAIELAPAGPAPQSAGLLTAAQLIERGLASTGVPAANGTAELTSDEFVVVPRGKTPTWTLRAGLARSVTPDPLRPKPGPLLAARPTGSAAPRVREKMLALGRRKAGDARFRAIQRARHAGVRLLSRLFVAPIAWVLAGIWFRTGRVTAAITPVSGAPTMVCIVRRNGRRLTVTAPAAIHEPAVVRLEARRFLGFMPAWRLQSARIDA